ncbi:hypothetical protein C4K22_2207 [Pseudomonas chlororaphis subsp. aurantiaca]|uniref:Uncharacterized protein n=1 Tax=Pseudomonas chlororaphis subsp. aureofaciens TaxID=587851 RepID=A0AAD0ZHF6_9PSED|nr:hypothetical protein C4K35_2188 [Pseudomonas chlororaphis subsp. piscium]AZD21386.1 hypothetical protein C4K24_2082 [Pseudomonas chlororaphis subsp. aurantiaca]AZD28813.1 hypothetical protein C4K23_2063 [Pseudomonas chlororaphis]AZD85081.1 hypothetical protein C4K14_2256 [Pseudomonas chlororaphis subsp. aureofaciens]AZC56353.1 hypothetical protein C4K34_2187 [Pseudomonas chlororaphis subsp. piscium]
MLVQVHLDTPETDLNAAGEKEEQDLYQPDCGRKTLLT